MATEKLDLRNLFEPVCAKFHVPITNLKGWSDLNARAAMMRRFKQHEAAGRRATYLSIKGPSAENRIPMSKTASG